eukprot:3678081-Amphidinium_carterae.1
MEFNGDEYFDQTLLKHVVPSAVYRSMRERTGDNFVQRGSWRLTSKRWTAPTTRPPPHSRIAFCVPHTRCPVWADAPRRQTRS